MKKLAILQLSALVACAVLNHGCAFPMAPTTVGNASLVNEQASKTPKEAWPQVEPLPVLLNADAISTLAASSMIDRNEINKFRSYFQTKGDFPVAKLTYTQPNMNMEHGSQVTGGLSGEMVMKLDGESYAMFEIYDWNNNASIRFSCETKAPVKVVHRQGIYSGSNNTQYVNDYYTIAFVNAMSKLVSDLNAKRAELVNIQQQYSSEKR